jgi:hypothetical protein
VAAGRIPKPGTAVGPCIDECTHTDCAATREQADALCKACRKVIGYDVRYYRVDQRDGFNSAGYAHAACIEN